MQDWERIKELVAAALEHPESERTAYLDLTCDPDLRAEVESLLKACDDTGVFLESSAIDDHRDLDLNADTLIGARLGPWLIVARIGEGGMGSVYRATRQDDQYQAQVAIKILRPGMSSHFTVNRFRTERQILARLNHPNIARLLDGGTTDDDRPYFVMELVDGVPLDEYCDRNKLSTVARLELFRQVCSAVQYAHANLIVHRDLKPTNILVTPDGVPKLLDFGIAKILHPTESPEYVENTVAMVRMMTPDYASPEQIRGEAITTASDVYALGVVLYELLTGHHPYRRKKPVHELERLICEVDPEKPSSAVKWVETVTNRHGETLVLTPEWVSGAREGRPDKLMRRLRGDLDNIVMRAMKKEPEKRYESAGQLSHDLRRYLDDEPVIARADTPLYRASKFYARNRGPVIAALTMVLVIVAGAIVTLQQARVAHRERERAERRFNDVRHLATSFLFEFHDAIRNLPGSTQARALVVTKALSYLDSLEREAGSDPSLRRELAEAYEKVSDVQGSRSDSNLGDTAAALRSARKALPLREALAAENPNNLDDQLALANTCSRVASLITDTGDSKTAALLYRKAFETREKVYAAHPSDLKMKRSLAVGYWELGVTFAENGAYEESLHARQKALELFEELRRINPTRATRRSVALVHKNIAATYTRMRKVDLALEEARKATEIDEALVKEMPREAGNRRDLSFSYSEMGEALADLGRHREALDYFQKSLAIRLALSDEDPKDQFGRFAVANMEIRLARTLFALNDYQGSLVHHQRALARRLAIANSDVASVHAKIGAAESYGDIGSVYETLHNPAQARASYVKALVLLNEVRDSGKLQPSLIPIDESVRKKATAFGLPSPPPKD